MKHTAYLLSLLALSFSLTVKAQPTDYVIDHVKDAEAFAAADWQWHEIAKDAEAGYAQFPIFGAVESISVVRYNPEKHRSDVFCCPGDKRSVVSAAGSANGAIAAVNGSYFNVRTLDHATYIKDEGKKVGTTYANELYRVNGAVAMKRHGSFEIVEADTLAYNDLFGKCREVMAGGPILIDDGAAKSYDSKSSFYQFRHPRTMVGRGEDGWNYLIVVDGRFRGQADGATIAEMVFLAEQFKLVDAINLDGGGSSTLWTAEDGVINHPFDNHRFDAGGERQVPNAILVY